MSSQEMSFYFLKNLNVKPSNKVVTFETKEIVSITDCRHWLRSVAYIHLCILYLDIIGNGL